MTTRANLYVDQGVDFLVSLELSTDSGNEFPLETQNFFCQARKMYSSTPILDASLTVTQDEETDILNMHISPEATQNIPPGKYQYDIVMIATDSGKRVKILEGLLFILPTITRVPIDV